MPRKKTKNIGEEAAEPVVAKTEETLPKKRKIVKIPFGVIDEIGIYRGGPDAARMKQLASDYPYDDDWIYERQEDGSFKRMWFRGLH